MKKKIHETKKYIVLLMMAYLFTAGCAGVAQQTGRTEVPEVFPGFLMSYLPPKAHPNGLALLPPPPADGTATFAADQATARETFKVRYSPLWKLAIEDAELKFPHAAGTFSCAIGAPINPTDTPRLYTLLRRAMTDAILSTFSTKNHYHRTRPFVLNKEPSCTPSEEKALASEGSYPSGHAAIGWTWALILAEIAPDKTDAILERGRVYGENRIVCNVHWQTDIVAGRILGAGTVARLHAVPSFRAELEAARSELNAVRTKGLPPTRNCEAEYEALSIKRFQ